MMSTNQSDNPRPLPRSNTLQPPVRPLIRSISQVYNTPHQPATRQVSLDVNSLRNLEPSAKRPKFEHEGLLPKTRDRVFTDISEPDAQTLESIAGNKTEERPYKLPPFPSRPGAHLQRTQSPVHQYFQNKEPVSSKPYVLEIPKVAPRYANKRPADFFPWTGEQPEDTINEHTIKNGYFDKASAPQTESASARPAIWSNVKHKSGLQLLSSLFVSTLQQRQKFGAVSSASTFKPPPRATLTEPKRELWLKDLADPDVPLRRLSRTIPHGIRGKILLDQCMAKKIPFERAIWLVKCVGANEIRAFKRKGPNVLASGSEAKWVREWTSNVEEFLDALIETCGSQDWKENINYGLQIVAHVYSESLVDKEHFLEWIISSFRVAPQHKIPIWVLMTELFWIEMPKCRQTGSKLAIALCEQAVKLQAQVVEANQGIWDMISSMVVKLITTETACFFVANRWARYSASLEAICKDHKEIFEHVQQRNEEMATFACMPEAGDKRQKILDILDDKVNHADIKTLSKKCFAITSCVDFIATTFCEIATTTYRPGLVNMFLCLRSLRRWGKQDLDLESQIFSFIRSCAARSDLDRQKLFRLISELVRSKHISISRYLQWIMAQGLPLPLERDLLLNIPLYGIPDYARNLCQMVLSCPLPSESDVLVVQAVLSERLFNDAMVDEDLDYDSISRLRLPEQYRLTHWLRNLLFEHADNDDELSNSEDLTTVCRLLEIVQDYGVLADTLGVYAEVGHISLLPIVLDKVNTHFECLQAIGATESICETILQRMAEVSHRSPEQKPLLQSLVDFVKRLPKRAKTLLVLQRELALCEPKSAIAACSPVSDTMGDTQEDITFFEEIEMLFGSGTSMDRPLLTRIFTDVVKRLETSWTDDIYTSIKLAEFLLRLRSFNREIFSTLMSTWVGTLLTRRQDIKTLLAVLICGGLVEVQELYTRLVTQTADTKAMPTAILEELLDLLLEQPSLPRAYHLQTGVDNMAQGDAQTLARFLSMVLERAGPGILVKSGLRDLILKLSVHSSAVKELFPIMKPAPLADLALGLTAESNFVKDLPSKLCYFNASLCAGRLRKTLNEYTGTDLSSLPTAIVEQIVQRQECKNEPWRAIIAELPRSTLQDTHELLVSSFLERTPNFIGEAEPALLSLLGLVENKLDGQDAVSTVTLLVDSLTKIHATIVHSTDDTGLSISTLEPQLNLIFQLLAIHASAFSQAQVPSTTALHLCLYSSNLYLSPLIRSNTDLSGKILNTLAVLSDALTSETREQTFQILKQHSIDSPDLRFLFGPAAQSKSTPRLDLITSPMNDANQQNKDKTRVSGSKPQGAAPAINKEAQSTPFHLNRWEMVQDATPMIGDNDTSLSLALFGARKAVL